MCHGHGAGRGAPRPAALRGRLSGLSIPIGTIAGRASATTSAPAANYVRGTPKPTAIDRGNTYLTNKRVVFRGSRQTRECLFAKLIGFTPGPEGSTTF